MTHTSKNLDYTINCFIVKDQKVLLIYNKQYDMWLAPGGHIEPEENYEDAIFREIEEETGINKSELTLIDPRGSIPNENIFSDHEGARSLISPTFSDIHPAGNNHFHIAFRFFLITTAEVRGSVDEFVIKHEWLSEKDLDLEKYHLKKAVKYYAKYALNLKLKHK
jgi:8-oxo-dGTP pyrophosphatase MutT (NUDIX family)